MPTRIHGNRIAEEAITTRHLSKDIMIPQENVQGGPDIHSHSNEAVLDKLKYSGSKSDIDLKLFETILEEIADAQFGEASLKDALLTLLSRVDFDPYRQEIESARNGYDTLFDYLQAFRNGVNDAIGTPIELGPPTVGFNGYVYSLLEVPVGIWIDGKTIYQKTVNFGPLPNANQVNIKPHDIEDVDWVVNREVSAQDSDGNSITLPAMPGSSTSTTSRFNVSSDKTSILIWTNTNMSDYKAYVTMRYTKA